MRTADTYRLGVLDEDFGAAELILVTLHVHTGHKVVDALLDVTTPLRPCLRGQDGVTTRHFLVTTN